MATTSSSNKLSPLQHQDLPRPSVETATQQPLQLDSSPNPTNPTVTSVTPPADSKGTTPATVTSRTRELSSTDSDVIHIPSYSRWFSWNNIHECEVRFLPEFFDGRSASKNPRIYKYYRNAIIRRFRENFRENPPSKDNPTPKITFTEARKTIIGDVGSVRRVFDFLEAWGLINYYGSKPQLRWEDKESKSNAASLQSNDTGGDVTVPRKRFCSSCKSVCTIACFEGSQEFDVGGSKVIKQLTLCARCFVRGGVNSSDFKRVEISEEVKTTNWTDKETLNLLEAIMHYGDDWKKVAEHVRGRSEKECVNRFITLPFGEQFFGPRDSAELDEKHYQTKDQLDAESGVRSFASSSPSKRMRLTPLADASNPIMAQAAFLSALVGVEVAEAAACAAVKALSEVNSGSSKEICVSSISGAREQESYLTSNGETTTNSLGGAHVEARLQLEKEEQDLERAVSDIAEVQAKEIHDKIVHFEEVELQMEREWQHVQQMQNLLFIDQLTLLSDRTAAAPKRRENMEENVKTE